MGLVAAVTALVAVAPSADAEAGRWTEPTCATVDSPGSLTYTNDEGATLKPTSTAMTPTTYAFGLSALDTPNTLVAVQEYSKPGGGPVEPTVLRSTDAGCHWTTIGALKDGWVLETVAAPGGRTYLWPAGSGENLYLVTGTTITPRPIPAGIAGRMAGFGVDRRNGSVVRFVDTAGQTYVSTDAGRTWTKRGVPIGGEYSLYRAAFDPADLNHVVVGTGSNGAYVTFDGGVTWTQSSGLDLTPAGRLGVNVFTAAVSPANRNVVYAMGLDIDQADAHDPSDGRHLYRSTDGGRTFAPIVDQNPDVTLPNGPLLAPSPVDPGVLYFVFGMNYGGYGTDLYKWTAATGQVTKTHNAYDEISSIAFNPAHPNVMYLGLASEPDGV